VALHRLTGITVGVPDVDAAIAFYEDFGLEHLGDGRFATVDGGEQLRLATRPRRGLMEIGVGADDHDDLDRIVHELTRSSYAFTRDGDDVLAIDSGSGVQARVSIADRYEQKPVELAPVNAPGVVARPDERAPGAISRDVVRPRKLGHVVIGSTDVEASEHLFVDVLGFQVSDTIRDVGKFVRCSTDHHNLMVSKAPAQFLHHTSWQVDDLDAVGRGASAMLAKDPTRHAWGLGRHNVGSNFFWYLRDPAGNLAEYYSDLDIITEQLRWEPGIFDPREGSHNWGPRPPRGFFGPGPDDLAELMMKSDG
jgi:catechol 2,3-dioxygenase-like lactoylglutathione lyase family enzyme